MKFLSSIISVILILSCEQKFETDIPNIKPALVINSLFCPDSLFRVHLSENFSRFDDLWKGEIAENATIQLFEEGNYIQNLVYKGNGNYFSADFKPEAGNEYKITVSSIGFDTVIASSKVPETVPFSIINSETYSDPDDPFFEHFSFRVNIDDPDTENYYYFFVNEVNKKYNRPYIEIKNTFFEVNDPVIGNFRNELGATYFLFTDKSFNGNKVKFDVKSLYDLKWKIIYFNLANLSQEMYLYLETYDRDYNSVEFIAEPVRIYSNIKGGRGIFAGYNLSRDSIYFPGNL